MKVVQINAVYGYSSTGRTCLEMQDAFLEKGIACHTFYGERKVDFPNTTYVGCGLDHKLHALFSRITGKVGYGSKLQTKALIKKIKKYNPDVIHLRNLHSNFVNIPMLLRYIAKKNIPTVITLHDCFMFTGKCCHYIDDNCIKWTEGCSKCPAVKKWNKSWFFDRTKKMYNDKKKLLNNIQKLAVIGVSKWIADEAKKSSILEKAKMIDYIYNWIDFSVFYQRENNSLIEKFDLNGKKIVLGVSSLWLEEKGLNDFIELSKILPEDYHILLVGKLKKGIVLPNNITCVGSTSDTNQLAEYYSVANVFVSPSVQETFGKTVAEAISCGTPVCVYNNTALPELVKEGCGAVVPVKDIQALAEAVVKVCKKGKEAYSENCYKHSRENFDLNKNIEKYIEVYRKLINV